MKTKALVIIIVLCLVFLQVFGGRVRSIAHEHRRESGATLTDYELRLRNQNTFARILGEFRTGVADMMFMKTEVYVHGGMAWVPHLDSATMMREGETVEQEPDEGYNSLIPPKEHDFRGIIGDMERAVKPFDLTHVTEPKDELLPWYRLMTTMDPHYVRGYRLGTLWLIDSKDPKRWSEALDFINEGIALNQGHPEEFRLHLTRAVYFIKLDQAREKLGSTQTSDELLTQALSSARLAYETGLRERPPSGKVGEFGRHILWTLDHEEDFLFGVRYVPTLLRDLGRAYEALEAVKEMRRIAPNDGPLRRREAELMADMGM
jgi:tetratricopeptide (TPR) repeat protein